MATIQERLAAAKASGKGMGEVRQASPLAPVRDQAEALPRPAAAQMTVRERLAAAKAFKGDLAGRPYGQGWLPPALREKYRDLELQALDDTQTHGTPRVRDANLYDLTIGSVKRGYDNAIYGREAYKSMTGQENDLNEYARKMAGEQYSFQPSGILGKAVSGASELLGQQLRQWTDPASLAMAATGAVGAAAAGVAGPQALVPEEIITVPAAAMAGLQMGSAKANMEIEAGQAYLELLENGVSEETAKKIATGVGVVNAGLEMVQLDELFKSFKVLDKMGADDKIVSIVARELGRRGVDVAKETLQEVGQEGVTIAGTQLGSMTDKGEWAYKGDEVLGRLGDTALSSAMSFGVMNVPGGVSNIARQVSGRKSTSTGPVVMLPKTGEGPVMLPRGEDSFRGAQEGAGGVHAAPGGSTRAVEQAVQGQSRGGESNEVRSDAREDITGKAREDALRDVMAAKVLDSVRNGKAFGETGRNAFSASFDRTVNAEDYYADFARAYNAGMTGKKAGSTALGVLTPLQRQVAWQAGRKDAGISLRAQKSAEKPASRNPGLNWNDAAKAMDTTAAANLDTIGRRLGVEVLMDDTMPAWQNGKLSGTTLHINPKAADPVQVILQHEVTHRIQQLAPDMYKKYRDYAMRFSSEEEIRSKRAVYAEHDVTLSNEETMDEIVADFPGKLLTDERTIRSMASTDRSFAKKIMDIIRDVAQRIKEALGWADPTMERAVQLWENALRAAEKQAGKAQKNTAQEGGGKFSIEHDQNNAPYVVVENDILEGVPQSDWVKTVKNNLRDKFPDGVEVGNNVIHINQQSRKEMTYSKYMQRLFNLEPELYADKLRATNNADEILKASRNYVNEALLHPRNDDIIDFARGEVQLRVGSNDYIAQVIVGNRGNNKGLMLYDIINLSQSTIKEQTKKAGAAYTDNTQKESLSRGPAPTEHSIPQEASDVNSKFSIKDEERLRSVAEDLRNQMKRTTRPKADTKAVRAVAADLLEGFESQMDKGDLAGRLQSLYDRISGDRDISYSDMMDEAVDVAREVVEGSLRQTSELYEQYGDLRQELKGKKISVAREHLGELDAMGGYDAFRKDHAGQFKLTDNGVPVDSVYEDLSARYPELFPEDLINPADRLLRIADVADDLGPVFDNPYSAELDGAAQYLAGEILERYFDVPQAKPTFADRKARQLVNQKIQDRKKLERARELTALERQKRKDQVNEVKRHYQAKEKKGREARSAQDYRRKIEKHCKDLSGKLLRPTDKKHIPETLKAPVAAMLESINRESANGKPTKRTEAFAKLKEAYGKIKDEGQPVVVDPDLRDNLDAVEAMGDKPIAEMGVDELETIWHTIRAVEASITSFNKMLARGKYQTISQLADDIMNDNMLRVDRGAFKFAFARKADGLLNEDMLTPNTFLHRLGKGGDAIFRMMRNAQDRQTEIILEAADQKEKIFGKDDIRAMEKKEHTFHLLDGEITLTTAQVMELYNLTRREQAQDHIYVGGIRPDETAGKGRAAPFKVTPEEVAEIVSALSSRERQIAEGMQAYMSGPLAEHGNEASEAVYGYRKFTEKNYWPITVDKNQTTSDPANEAVSKTIPGMGSAKATKAHANNGLILNSAFDTYAKHVAEMAKYAAWLGTSESMTKLANYAYRGQDGARISTIKTQFEKVYGSGGLPYFTRLLEDVAAGTKVQWDTAFSMEGAISNFKAAAIAYNLRVVVQQPTAALRALDMIAPKYFAKGMVRKGDWEKVKKYAPIAQWKDWGYFEANTGRSVKSILTESDSFWEKAKQLGMAPAGWADSVTWARIWNACEAEMKDTRKDLTAGSEEFYRAVGERFTEVIDQTQVVDSVMHRSQIMRSKSDAMKMATSFMSETIETYNMFMRRVYDFHSSKGAERTKARKAMGRTAAALIASFAVNAVAQSFPDGIRDDDREKGYWDKFLSALFGFTGEEETVGDYLNTFWTGNFQQNFNPFGYVPYAKDVVSIFQGYDVVRQDMEGIGKFINSCLGMLKAMSGEGKKTTQAAFLDLMMDAGRLLGVGTYNIKRDVVAFANTAFNAADSYLWQYRMDSFFYNPVKDSGRFYDILWNAKQNDPEAYEIIYDGLVDQGLTPVKIESAMRSRYKDQQGKNYKADPGSWTDASAGYRTGEDTSSGTGFDVKDLSPKQQTTYYETSEATYEEIMEGAAKALKRMNAAETDKVMDAALRYANEQAKAEAMPDYKIDTEWMLWAAAGQRYGVDETEAILFKAAYDMSTSDKGKDGKAISGSKKENTLELAEKWMPGLTHRELDYLMSGFWKSAD